MKNLSVVLGIVSLLVSAVSFADYNTDAISGSVTCKGAGVSVTINAKRSQITVKQNGESELYDVGNARDSDGDTQVTYPGSCTLPTSPIKCSFLLTTRAIPLSLMEKRFR